MYYVYIIKSDKDGSFYIGVTTDLKRRLQEHNSGNASYSRTKAPYQPKWYCVFPDKQTAYKFERYLKSSSGHAFRNKHLL